MGALKRSVTALSIILFFELVSMVILAATM